MPCRLHDTSPPLGGNLPADSQPVDKLRECLLLPVLQTALQSCRTAPRPAPPASRRCAASASSHDRSGYDLTELPSSRSRAGQLLGGTRWRSSADLAGNPKNVTIAARRRSRTTGLHVRQSIRVSATAAILALQRRH